VHLDIPGALTVTVSIAALIYGLSQGQQHGFTGVNAIAAFAIAVVWRWRSWRQSGGPGRRCCRCACSRTRHGPPR
jgi:hypothetical protein